MSLYTLVLFAGLVRLQDTQRHKRLSASDMSWSAPVQQEGANGNVVQMEYQKRDFKPEESTIYYGPNTFSK